MNQPTITRPSMVIASTKWSHQESADALSRLFGDAAGQSVERREMPGLAGPNHTIQILFEQAEWLYFFGGLLGSGIWTALKDRLIEKAVDRGLDSAFDSFLGIFKTKEKPLDAETAKRLLDQLLDQASKAQRANNSVVVGLPISTTTTRHVGIELPLLEDGKGIEQRERVKEIFRQLAACAWSIQKFFDDYPKLEIPAYGARNSDCSLKIRLSPKGDLRLRFLADNLTPMDVAFEPDAYRIVDPPSGLDIAEGGQVVGEPDDALEGPCA